MQTKFFSLFVLAIGLVICDQLAINLPPRKEVIISNPLFFAISKTCEITSSENNNLLIFKLNLGSASLNDTLIPLKEELKLNIRNREIVKITSSPYANIQVTNEGNTPVNITCRILEKQTKILRKTYEYIMNLIKNDNNEIWSYDFLSNSPVIISNPLFFGVSASCKVSTQDESDILDGKILKGSGTLNGQTITSNTTLTIKNGESFNITASAFASVEITNKGSNTVHADCSLSYEALRYIYLLKGFLEEYFYW